MRTLILFALGALLLAGCLQPPSGGAKIRTFEDCVAAGNPVMESYPRQCRSADGSLFISGTDFLEVNLNTSCANDSDCMLIDKKLGFNCCYADACKPLNYSQDSWVSVNRTWFSGVRTQHCPPAEECGPAPLCAVRIINDSFHAKCVYGMCVKAPKR